jgi:uncharacterized integral membrane protein
MYVTRNRLDNFFFAFFLTIVLTMLNTHQVVLNYYIDHIEINLAVLLLISLCLGILLGFLSNLIWASNILIKNRKIKKLYQQALQDSQQSFCR